MKFVVAISVAFLLSAPFTLSGSPAAADGTIAVSLSEFAISAVPGTSTPGTVTFNVSNDGEIIHDFHVIRSSLAPGSLPVDGQTNQVDFSQVELVASTQIIQAGASDSTVPDLTEGNYVLICNVPQHYDAGMYAGFTVAQAPVDTPTAPPTNGATALPTATGGPGTTDTGGDVTGPITGSGPASSGESGGTWLLLGFAAGAASLLSLLVLRQRSR